MAWPKKGKKIIQQKLDGAGEGTYAGNDGRGVGNRCAKRDGVFTRSGQSRKNSSLFSWAQPASISPRMPVFHGGIAYETLEFLEMTWRADQPVL